MDRRILVRKITPYETNQSAKRNSPLETLPNMDATAMTPEEREHYLLEERTRQARNIAQQVTPENDTARGYTVAIRHLLAEIDVLTNDCDKIREQQRNLVSLIRQKNTEVQALNRQMEICGKFLKYNRQRLGSLNKPLQEALIRRQRPCCQSTTPLKILNSTIEPAEGRQLQGGSVEKQTQTC
jgi:chromosome segregation ATPase